ncbi:hypothetical protein [Paenisporosarcina sp. TG20]|uniref:hypothetical protein n=1 Tax=Paenisporosarcina sp. TG20 TaxID=1211706 RepID=UPI000364540B|nr:hypothetical protein [Paenisporosarcina sp. TG20]
MAIPLVFSDSVVMQGLVAASNDVTREEIIKSINQSMDIGFGKGNSISKGRPTVELRILGITIFIQIS